jgi:hypothetical protein
MPTIRTPESAEYAEPDPAELVRVLRVDDWGHEVLSRSGYRIKAIEEDETVFEPRQAGVHRYPPVRVQFSPEDSPPDSIDT